MMSGLLAARPPEADDATAGCDPVAKICVGIASRGRPGVLAAVVERLGRQTLPPSSILISCTGPEDCGALALRDDVTVLIDRPGLARQRNAVLRNLPPDADIVVFFDDDFVPHDDWLRVVEAAFRRYPDVACITGRVVADGILGPGLALPDACAQLDGLPTGAEDIIDGYSPYGCNMALRRAAIGALRFDERLVLYGWLEDYDFGGALAQSGCRLIKLGAALGVHLGVKSGRVSGRKLGYSQVMNPLYLNRKGTMGRGPMISQIIRNVAANLGRSLAPEPFIDRRGRLRGNLIAAADLVRGRLTPERAEQL
jgi:GT2 family glycosyltransferase